MRLLFVPLLLLTLQAPSFDQLDARIERNLKSGGIPGAAVVVVKDGAVVHSRAFGVTSVETSVPVTTKTLFRLGSTTKMFVALAVLKLVDDGKVRLDQPVGELVSGLSPPIQRLTVEQLLTHTSGLADDAPMSGPLDESAMHLRVLTWREDALLGPAGEVFSYANPGYVLLGDVIAQVTKQPFSTAMQTLVLGPMGMTESSFRPLEAFTRPVALGHDGAGVIRPMAEHAGNYPPGSLFTTAENLGKFLSSLSSTMLERLAQPRASIVAQSRAYGYGVIVDTRRGPRLVLHTGGRTGYGSMLLFVPEQQLAVAVMTNRTGVTMSDAAFAAIEPYVTVADLPAPAAPATLTSAAIASIAGSYRNGSLPEITLAGEGARLLVTIAGKSLEAVSIGSDRFFVKGGGQLEQFTIVRDAAGAARYVCAETWAFRKRS